MRHAFYDDPKYRQKQAEITHKYWKLGVFDFKRKLLEERVCKNPQCVNLFNVKSADPKKFCSQSCAANVNNKKRIRVLKRANCLFCERTLQRADSKYCSFKCQSKYGYLIYINEWKEGIRDGNKGIKTRFISAHIRHYLIEKYNSRCSVCGWSEINPTTRKIPLEVDHIDGNSENNKEENLRILCPNCHSLTPTFKNLNKGNGRAWRLKKTSAL